VAEHFVIHDPASPERDINVRTSHTEVVASPVSTLTIEHDLPYRYHKVILFDADGYELPRAVINTILHGEHSPVVTNQFYVEIEFNTGADFVGTVILEPYLA